MCKVATQISWLDNQGFLTCNAHKKELVTKPGPVFFGRKILRTERWGNDERMAVWIDITWSWNQLAAGEWQETLILHSASSVAGLIGKLFQEVVGKSVFLLDIRYHFRRFGEIVRFLYCAIMFWSISMYWCFITSDTLCIFVYTRTC